MTAYKKSMSLKSLLVWCHAKTFSEYSVSMNCSNPSLRWGHNSHPIKTAPESGIVPWANQHVRGFLPPVSSFPNSFFFFLSFFLKFNFMSNNQLPQAGVFRHLFFFFLWKLFFIWVYWVSLTLLCCCPFIHKIHNAGGNPLSALLMTVFGVCSGEQFKTPFTSAEGLGAVFQHTCVQL